MKSRKMFFMRSISLFVVFIFLASLGLVIATPNIVDTAGLSLSLVNQNPDPAVAGDIVEARVSLQNIGSAAISDVLIEAMPSYPFTLVSGQDAIQSVGTLESYQGQYDKSLLNIVKYKLKIDKDATPGTYEFKVKAYQNGSKSSVEKTLPISLSNRDSGKSIKIDTTQLVPGKETKIKFTIDNVGSTPLRNLVFDWSNDDKIILPVGSDSTKYISYLDVGKSVDLEYSVIADTNAAPGLYKLNLYLTYKDSLTNQDVKISTLAGMYVGGDTDFDVAFSESTNGAVSFSIANVGSNPASSVSVSIPEQRNWRVTGSNSAIIGNLNKGDYTVASFKLQSNADTNLTRTRAAGQGQSNGANPADNPSFNFRNDSSFQRNSSPNIVSLIISYTNTQGERKAVEKQIRVQLQSAGNFGRTGTNGTAASQSLFSTYGWYIAAILIVVGGYIAYNMYKKKNFPSDENPKQKFFSKKK